LGIPAHNFAQKATTAKEIFEDELKELAIDYYEIFGNAGVKTRYAMQVAMLFKEVVDQNSKYMTAANGAVPPPSSTTQKNINEELLRKYENL
jgi:hypothetical protein